MTNNRTDILEEASALIDGNRDVDYGDPLDNFTTTAELWQPYLERIIHARGGLDLNPHDVAIMMTLVKVARLAWTPHKRDHWADIAGYTGCGWDCVVRQDG
jgi:hypothetical protein